MSTGSDQPGCAHHRIVKLLSRTKIPTSRLRGTKDGWMELGGGGSMCGTKAVKKKIRVTVKVAFTAL